MNLTHLISNYAIYNEWANQKIVDWLKDINHGLLEQNTTSSFKTIDQTLQHISLAQKFWCVFIINEDVSNFSWIFRKWKIDQTCSELLYSSAQLKINIQSLSEDALIEKMELDTTWANNKLSRFEYIMHVINHSTYHRGQIVTMARTLGINEGIPNTDYNMFNSILKIG